MVRRKKSKVTWTVYDPEIDQQAASNTKKAKKKIKLHNPYPDHKCLGYAQVLFSFGDVWCKQCIYKTRCTRCMRLTLAIVIPFFLIYGLVFTTTSLWEVFGSKKMDNLLPFHSEIVEFYWGVAAVGLVLIIVAMYGIVGIYRKRVWSTKVFAVVSYIYGQTSMTVSSSWLLLVQIESSNSTFFNKTRRPWDNMKFINLTELPFPIFGATNGILKHDVFILFIVEIVFLQSLFLTVTGLLTTLLLIKDNKKKGFSELESGRT